MVKRVDWLGEGLGMIRREVMAVPTNRDSRRRDAIVVVSSVLSAISADNFSGMEREMFVVVFDTTPSGLVCFLTWFPGVALLRRTTPG